MGCGAIRKDTLYSKINYNFAYNFKTMNMEDRLIIAFNISKTYDLLLQGKGDRTSIYDCTRRYWGRVKKQRAELAELAFGVAHGKIVGVYKPVTWRYVDYNGGTRIEFEGVEISDSPYLGLDISEYFHKIQNPVRYIGRW